MADLTPTDPKPRRETLSSAAADRRSFLRRAALVGIPVVIATVPSRTVWAGQPKKPGGKGGSNDTPKKPGGAEDVGLGDDPTGAAQMSFHASGSTNVVPSLL